MMKSIKTLMISAVVCGAMVLPVFSTPNFQTKYGEFIGALWFIQNLLGCNGQTNEKDLGEQQLMKNCTNVGVIRESLGISTSQMEAAENKVSNSKFTPKQVTKAFITLLDAAGCKQSDSTNSRACKAIDATIQGVADKYGLTPGEMMDEIQAKQEDASGTSQDQ